MRVRSLVLLAAVLGLPACSNLHVRADITLPADERVSQRSFQQVTSAGGVEKVVLRVPMPQSNLAQEAQRSQSENDLAYNVIEKEFLKAGFTVRDRALLSEILRDNPDLDYTSIRDKIDTDVILEVVSLTQHDFTTYDYTDIETNQKGRSQMPLGVTGWRMEAKVVLVRTGEVGAMYTFFWQDTDNDFVLDQANMLAHTAGNDGTPEPFTSYAVPIDRAARGFAQKIIHDLRGGAAAQPGH
jgi:hypothetical protein